MHQPPGFRDPRHPDHVCHLQRSLYALKHAPKAWFQWFASYDARVGFHHIRYDSSLFIYRQGSNTTYLLLYVDDIVSTAFSSTLLHQYPTEVLERANMLACNLVGLQLTQTKNFAADGDLVSDPTLYRCLAGALQYLTFTRPGISYTVQHVCLFMHDPREPYFSTLKRILRYVRGTLDNGLQLYSCSTSSLVAYSDADCASCPTTRRSTSAGYKGVANAVAETCWLRNLLRELYTPLSATMIVYCDNVIVIYLSSNPLQHQRTKHIEIDIHFVRNLVTTGHVRVLHVPSRYQFTCIFTKGLPTALFDEFRSSLSARSFPAQTARGC
nr:ribonuclease H-like domain-containing protein [Tanacetum cinerariifolium]